MNARTGTGSIMGWLIRGAFQQTLSEGLFWLALFVSLLTILACLTVTIEPAGPATAQPRQEIRALFGLVRFELPGDRAAAARTLQASIAGLAADSVGVLLMLLWTAAILPRFLEPASVTVLLAKPVSRWRLLLGKCLGVLAFVSVQALILVFGTWLALGWRTGWHFAYLLCLPLALVQFLVFFSFSAMLAVATRSTVASLFGVVVFWLLCWGTNIARHAVRSASELSDRAGSLDGGVELSYWILPRPLDLQLILTNALGADLPAGGIINLPLLAERGLWAPATSVLASLLFAAVVFAVAAYDFATADY